jgi:hypothetical protein
MASPGPHSQSLYTYNLDGGKRFRCFRHNYEIIFQILDVAEHTLPAAPRHDDSLAKQESLTFDESGEDATADQE